MSKGAIRGPSSTKLTFRVHWTRGVPNYFETFPEVASFALVSSAAMHQTITIDVLCPTRAAAKKWGGEAGVKKWDAMSRRGVPEVFERYKLPPVEYIDDIDG